MAVAVGMYTTRGRKMVPTRVTYVSLLAFACGAHSVFRAITVALSNALPSARKKIFSRPTALSRIWSAD